MDQPSRRPQSSVNVKTVMPGKVHAEGKRLIEDVCQYSSCPGKIMSRIRGGEHL